MLHPDEMPKPVVSGNWAGDGHGKLSAHDRRQMREFLSAVKDRQLEALKLYDPLPFQQAFHQATNKEVIIVKANQVGGPAHVDTPVLTPSGWRKLGELCVGDQVIGGDGKPCNVTAVHPQGALEIFRVRFSDGSSTNCANNHHWKCRLQGLDGPWSVTSLQSLRELHGDDPLHGKIWVPSLRGGMQSCIGLSSIALVGTGECVCITVDSPDHTYVTEDYIVTHNSLASFVEVARAATNQDPHNKYPKTGVAVCLGYGEGHIGRVIHRYLFRYGAFNIIQDRETGEWRTFRPWAADKEVMGKFGDAGREEEIRPSPPLIPKRFIEGIAWEKRANHVFSLATLNTGWEIHAFNSQGEAEMAQGFQADLFLIDEDVATGGWYVEALGRTAYRKGKIRWNALPHNKTEDLVQMAQRAEDEEGNPNATTICLRATMFDNPYYPEESKEHNAKAWKAAGEDVYRARALGEFTIDSTRMYPTFSKEVHDAINRLTFIEQEHERNGRQMRAKVQKVLTESGGEPPMDWCRYMVYDPGFNVGAVTFYAVPPPHEFGNFKICYDMLYLTNCTASKWGDEVELKMRNKHFQDFIIDAHGARLRELGSGVLPRRQYEMELEKRGLVCEARGSRFTSGSDDVKGREMAVRTWLEIRSGENPLERGYPTLLINMDRCANLVKEILQFRKKMVKVAGKEIVSDEGNRKTAVHAVETLEYAAAHGLPYVAPPRRVAAFKTYADEIREGRKYREARRRARGQGMGDGNVNLGPRGGSEEEW